MGMLVSGASAFGSWGGVTEELWTNLVTNITTRETILQYCDSQNYEYMFIVTRGNNQSGYTDYTVVVVSNKPLMNAVTGGFGLCSFDSDVKFRYYNIASDGTISNYVDKTSYFRDTNWGGFHIYWYLNSTDVWWLQSGGIGYASYDFLQEDDNNISAWDPILYPANLTGLPWQDNRVFEVWKSVDYPESSNPLEYINVKVDGYSELGRVSTAKIRFDYVDQDGNNLYKVFSESDFHDIQYNESDDYYTFYIFPYLISSYEFSIISSTYYSSTEWADKTIELDLTFNEGTIYPLPQDWNSVYTVNQYFSSRSNGTINGGVTKLALSDSGYLWIDYYQKVCHQAFDVKVLFIPYFMNSDLLSINLETLFQLYEQFDVIFTGVQPAQFNLLIPTLDYNDLFTYYSQNGFYPALKKLQEAFVFYSNLAFNKDYSDYTWTLSTDEVGFIVTRSFLLKRTLTALGDIDNRLLEFETNLVGEDSLGASLQTKLDNILSLEHDFFTDVSNFFQKLEYNLNGLSLGRIEKYLEDIWSATVGERNFNYTDLLPEPLKSIFLYFRGWFISSTQYMQDFIDVSNSSLYGDDLMKLPFEATVVPVLPFEPGTPTPIPIPTLEAGLIEVGGD